MADVEVKRSGIEGLGVFAARRFRAGERIRRVNVVREITPDSPIREDLGERVEGGASYLVARRAIAAGEEITCDYNINIAHGTAWPCRCGAARCRGDVAGDYFRLPQGWQREYRPFLAEWFVRPTS